MKNSPLSLVTLPLIALSALTSLAQAAEITISDPLTDPVDTATIDAGNPGDILIDSTGSITLTTGTAVTLNSDNSVTNDGSVTVEDSDSSVGVFLTGGYIGQFLNSGTIDLIATDGETRAMWKSGLILSGATDFTGDITNAEGGAISVVGDQSVAVQLDAPLVGDFTNEGIIRIAGSDNFGVLVSNTIDGLFRNAGSISSDIIVLDLDDDPDTLDLFSTGPAVAIGSSISGGFLNDGLTYEELNDEIEDDPVLTGAITSQGSAQTIHISPTYSSGALADLTLGSVSSISTGESFVNLGTIDAQAQDTVDVTAILIEGAFDGIAYTTTLTGGLRNDGSISASAVDADAQAISIGDYTVVPSILNNGTILARGRSNDLASDAITLNLSTTPGSLTVTNVGTLEAQLYGDNGSATVIYDATGALSTLTNTGEISAWLYTVNGNTITESDLGTAINTSLGSTGLTLINERAVDDEDGTTGIINGDIVLSTGAFDDSIQLNSGAITGDISFGGGTDYFYIGTEGIFTGDIAPHTSLLTAEIEGEVIFQSPTLADLSDLTLESTSRISIPIDILAGTSAGFNVANTATISNEATFIPLFDVLLTGTHTFDIVTANTLTLNGGLPMLDRTEVPFIYNVDLLLDGALQLQVDLKTAGNLGLSPLQTLIYDPLLEIAEINSDFTHALFSLNTETDIYNALNNLAPDDTGGSWQVAMLTFEGIANSALNPAHRSWTKDNERARFWIREGVFYRDQGEIDDRRGYVAKQFEMSGGAEVSTQVLDRLGLALSLSAASHRPDGINPSPYGAISLWFSAYASKQIGNFEINGIGSYATTDHSSDRSVTFGPNKLQADGSWSGTHFAGRLEGKFHFGSDELFMEPRASISFLSLEEDSYVETGDVGVIVQASDVSMDGFSSEFSTIFGIRQASQKSTLTALLELGWRQDFGVSDFDRDYQFIEGTMPFNYFREIEDQGAAIVGLSFHNEFGQAIFGVDYKGAFSSDASDHRIQAILKWWF